MKIPGINRLIWIVYKRLYYQRRLAGFSAHWNTNAGGNLQFSEYNRLYKGSFLHDVSLGRFTYINTDTTVIRASIGSFCSIGPDVLIGGLGRHPARFLSTHPVFYSSQQQAGISFVRKSQFMEHTTTVIGNDVWMGTRSFVLDGLIVGDGVIIAANAVVTKNVPPFAIVGGVPAKIIRYRFSDEVGEFLLDWQWWQLPIHVLQKLAIEFNTREKWQIDDVKRLYELGKRLEESSM